MNINKIFILFLLTFVSISGAYSEAFFGGIYFTDNAFDNNLFMTTNSVSFYLDYKINENIKFYTRLTSGLKYYADYGIYSSADKIWINANNGEYKNFSIIPLNIDLMYVQIRGKAADPSVLNSGENRHGETNYSLIDFRAGRIQVNQGSGLVFNMKGDGLDNSMVYKNFRFRFFAVTNSLDYMPFFDFTDGSSSPVFTNWDRKRYPKLSNFSIDGNVNGFIGDIGSSEYNFYFNGVYNEDYSDADKTRLNNMRYASVLAGRIFTGLSFEFMQIYYQNFTVNFLANIDMIPEDYVATFPSRVLDVYNTFGGRYTSFYLSFNANGKIYRGLYYNFEGVYETGFDATYNDLSNKLSYKNALINTFAINTGITYFFDHKTRPTIGAYFMYAHGDPDVINNGGAVLNRADQDNNYKSPTNPEIGYVILPEFSNMIVIGISQTIKPFAALKNEVFSRIYLENDVILLLRPIVKGGSFLPEKAYYQKYGAGYEKPEKAFLGVEMDTNLLWQVFSDLTIQLRGGILIPNYAIYNYDVSANPDDARKTLLWKIGISLNVSF
jgi:hypothetical protein